MLESKKSLLNVEVLTMQVLKTSIQRIGRTFPKVGMNRSPSKREVSLFNRTGCRVF